MKKIFSILGVALCLSVCACDKPLPDDPTEDKPTSELSIDSEYLNKNLNKEKTTFEVPVQTTLAASKWYVDVNADSRGWLTAVKLEASVKITADENKTGAERSGQVKISSTSKSYTVNIKQYASNDLHIEADYLVRPQSAKATNSQSGADISLSYDDNVNTIFHSRWNPTGPFPFELRYDFAGQEEIDYIEYVPRSDGGNGCIKEVEVLVATDAGRTGFTSVGTYDFKGSSSPSVVNLPAHTVPTSVKFSVKSGVGDFVSCAEMRFYRKNNDKSLDAELLKVFTDLTCSALKPGVTAEDIASLDPAFHQTAEALLNDTYPALEKTFRIHQYQAYSDPVEWSERLMTKKYSNWDNPMGIAAAKGDKVIILVGDTHGANVSVQLVGETGTAAGKNRRPESQGRFYTLREGVNQIEADRDGQLFFMYTAVPATSKPITVHVPLGNGKFAGYFDLEEHKTDAKFAEIIAATSGSSRYFCVRGKRMLLYFSRQVLPAKIVDPITQWDNIITWQQDFMGIDDVRPDQWNNHLAGVSMEDAYMWASDWCMGFVEYSIRDKIMGLDKFNDNADNAWGPAHEMGHVNQTAINWASTTESSNNLFSNYVLYRFNRYNSRGRGLWYRFKAVYEKNQSWASMCNDKDADGPNIPSGWAEDPEIHMRLNWQLWNYYHRVKGDVKFFGRVFKLMRELGLNESADCGRKQLEYACACSEAAGEDLTDFFEAWGFFKSVNNSTISQYGNFPYSVSAAQIKSAKDRMAQYPKPKHALEYIEDRNENISLRPGDFKYDKVGTLGYYTTYEKNLKVDANASATVSGRQVTTKNCGNAVAIEVRQRKGDSYGDIRFASNYQTFEIPQKIDLSNAAVYAVQADGTRIYLANVL